MGRGGRSSVGWHPLKTKTSQNKQQTKYGGSSGRAKRGHYSTATLHKLAAGISWPPSRYACKSQPKRLAPNNSHTKLEVFAFQTALLFWAWLQYGKTLS